MKLQTLFRQQCLLTAAILLAPMATRAQWVTSGTNIYNSNTGNVGIGSMYPIVKLDVVGGFKATDFIIGGYPPSNTGERLLIWGTSRLHGSVSVTSGTFTAGEANFTGNVGIGTSVPSQRLEVAGNISLTQGASRRIFMGGQAGGTFGLAYNSANPDFGIFYTKGSQDYVSISPNGNAQNGSMNVFGNGKVNIATALTIGTPPSGSCTNAGLTIGTSAPEAIYAYNSDPGLGLGIYSGGAHVGLHSVGGKPPTCPLGFSGNAGVFAEALGDATHEAVGAEGYASGGPYAVGLRGVANSGTYANYGVLGIAPVMAESYAGYFVGDTYCSSGIWSGSDKKLKNNIEPLKSALEKIMALKPSSYTFKTEEYQQLNLPHGAHFGLIAQELETVFPGMVKDNIHPEMKDKEGKVTSREVAFKSVNYTELIPVLIAAMQEQQKTMDHKEQELEGLKKELAAIKAMLAGITTKTGTSGSGLMTDAPTSWIGQSVPNPATNTARIAYHLADDVRDATIVLYRADGSEVMKYPIGQTGDGNIIIDAYELKAGEYIYSLFTNKGRVDSKKMMIMK